MLNYDRLKRCLRLARKISRCLCIISANTGDPHSQSIELEVLCYYADKIKHELADQELEDIRTEDDEYYNSNEFVSEFRMRWGETDEEEE